jgi:hypothetical protein
MGITPLTPNPAQCRVSKRISNIDAKESITEISITYTIRFDVLEKSANLWHL